MAKSKPDAHAEYQAAKARYETWTEEQHAAPTAEMLADVATINEYELALGQAERDAEG